MAGRTENKERLNHTLETIVNILHEENIEDWFIMFGTLLGIVREDGCIESDNDIDILINFDYDKLKNVFEKRGFSFTYIWGINDSKHILKSAATEEFGSFDFYLCDVNENGDYNNSWHPIRVMNATPIEKREWRSTILNLPKNYMDRIVKLYGEDWKTPRIQQGPGGEI